MSERFADEVNAMPLDRQPGSPDFPVGRPEVASSPSSREPSEAQITAALAAMDEAFKVTDPESARLAKLPRDDAALKRLSREWWRVVLRAANAVDAP